MPELPQGSMTPDYAAGLLAGLRMAAETLQKAGLGKSIATAIDQVTHKAITEAAAELERVFRASGQVKP